MSNSDYAVKCLSDGFSCSQAVLSSHCEEYNLSKEMALKVSGALMILGLKYGKYEMSDTKSKDITYANVRRYTDSFKEQFGSIKCKDLIKYDISNEEELLEALKSSVFQSICPGLIRSSVEIVESIIGKSN